jgi:hypothetical protein
VEPHEPEQAVIARISKLRPAFSLRRIAVHLNEDGYLPGAGHHGVWNLWHESSNKAAYLSRLNGGVRYDGRRNLLIVVPAHIIPHAFIVAPSAATQS